LQCDTQRGVMMKEILLQKENDLKNGTKMMSITQKSEDSECRTKVYKSFQYHAIKAHGLKLKNMSPEISITKQFNTKTSVEKFTFAVNGFFYLVCNRHLLRVNFKHKLHILIQWKVKVFSPKKSEILT